MSGIPLDPRHVTAVFPIKGYHVFCILIIAQSCLMMALLSNSECKYNKWQLSFEASVVPLMQITAITVSVQRYNALDMKTPLFNGGYLLIYNFNRQQK